MSTCAIICLCLILWFEAINMIELQSLMKGNFQLQVLEMLSLNGEITLRRFIYVPKFKLNLISVHKLCQDTSCVVHFSHFMWFILGPSMKIPWLLVSCAMGYIIFNVKEREEKVNNTFLHRISMKYCI